MGLVLLLAALLVALGGIWGIWWPLIVFLLVAAAYVATVGPSHG